MDWDQLLEQADNMAYPIPMSDAEYLLEKVTSLEEENFHLAQDYDDLRYQTERGLCQSCGGPR